MQSATGFAFHPGLLDRTAQERLLAALQAALVEAPFFVPVMPRTGKPFSVRMSNLGPLGWVSDRAGYRYQSTHPETGRAWSAIPDIALDVWRRVAGYAAPKKPPARPPPKPRARPLKPPPAGPPRPPRRRPP